MLGCYDSLLIGSESSPTSAKCGVGQWDCGPTRHKATRGKGFLNCKKQTTRNEVLYIIFKLFRKLVTCVGRLVCYTQPFLVWSRNPPPHKWVGVLRDDTTFDSSSTYPSQVHATLARAPALNI